MEIPHFERLQVVEDEDVSILVNHITGERIVLPNKTDDGQIHYSPDRRHGVGESMLGFMSLRI